MLSRDTTGSFHGMQVPPTKESSHFPDFRVRVAEQMAGYRKRLADRLIHEREKKSYSQETLALKADVSPKTIKRIEEEKVDAPRRVTIRRIAEALEIDPDQLRPPEELEADQLNRIERKLDHLLDHFDLAELEELAVGDGQGPAQQPGQTESPPG